MIRTMTILTAVALLAASLRAQDATPPMPPGHPPISGVDGALLDGHGHKNKPGDVKGTLMIKVVQGTPGGPKPGKLDYTLHLMHGKIAVHHSTGTIDESGAEFVENLPVGIAAQPQIELTYQGATYQVNGDPMDPEHPDRIVRVTVYETTDTEPEWSVQMHYAVVKPIPGQRAYQVQELLVVDNPSDRVWLGRTDAHGHRVTFSLPLSDNTEGRERIENHRPLYPGTARYQFNYVVPVRERTATVSLSTIAPTRIIAVIVPDESGVHVDPDGLTPGQAMPSQDGGMMASYQAQSLAAGKTVSLKIVQPTQAAGAEEQSLSAGRIVLILVGGAVVLIGLGLVWFRKPAKAQGDGDGQGEA